MAPATQEQFDKDLKDLHLIYNYDVEVEGGKHESWKYEMWFFSRTRIVYAIHGGAYYLAVPYDQDLVI